jgi:hypothetical protein
VLPVPSRVPVGAVSVGAADAIAGMTANAAKAARAMQAAKSCFFI